MIADRTDDPEACVSCVQGDQLYSSLSHSVITCTAHGWELDPGRGRVLRMRSKPRLRLHNQWPTTVVVGAGGTRCYNEARLLAFLEGQISLRRNRVMLPSAKQAPRLSGTLRAFGEVTSELSREEISLDESLLIRKRKKKLGIVGNTKTWAELTDQIVARCSRQDEKKVSLCTC